MNCERILSDRSQIKFCSNRCQFDFQHRVWVQNWKSGAVSGNIGINVRAVSQHLKKYLIDKSGNKCSQCGWNKKHPVTGVVPLEIDHVNGDAENNTEKNLRLLCPNCHALTPFYKNLNRGKGRRWRMDKYIKS